MDAVHSTLPMSTEQMNALDAIKLQIRAWQGSPVGERPQLVLGYWGVLLSAPVPGKFHLKIFCYPVGAPLLASDWQAVNKIAAYLGAPCEPKHWTSGNNAFLEWEWTA